ncbi:hypothetical protein B0H13DRAFT_2061580 [Mycena leptocephala]|nr:hypothetical protein B0H13DRAFT_2061580 [Mycena leptocephala]
MIASGMRGGAELRDSLEAMIISASAGLELGSRMLERISRNHGRAQLRRPRYICTHCSAGRGGSGVIGEAHPAGSSYAKKDAPGQKKRIRSSLWTVAIPSEIISKSRRAAVSDASWGRVNTSHKLLVPCLRPNRFRVCALPGAPGLTAESSSSASAMETQRRKIMGAALRSRENTGSGIIFMSST